MTNEQEVIVRQAIKITSLEKNVLRLDEALSKQVRENKHHMTIRVQQEGIIRTLREKKNE